MFAATNSRKRIEALAGDRDERQESVRAANRDTIAHGRAP
jgi:hypothetical protein